MRISEHLHEYGWLWIIMLLMFAAFVATVLFADKMYAEAKQHFMAQCMQDHKEYECTALWRQGDPSTLVVPIPIIIPSGR
jgi:hypothetical protein